MGETISSTTTATVLLNSASQNPLTVTGTGTITVAAGDGVIGTPGEAWTVNNAGLIDITNTDLFAIQLDGAGTVANTGRIIAAEGSMGVDIGGVGTVTNSGTIVGGIDLEAGGSVVNTGLITSLVQIQGAAGTVTNGGTIAGGSFGLLLQDGGSVVDTGLITTSHGNAVVIEKSTAATVTGTVTVSGTIAAEGGEAIVLSLDVGRVILDPGAVLRGGVRGYGSINTLELATAGTTAAPGTLAAFDGTFTGFGTVTVDAGAQWTLAAGASIGPGVAVTLLGGTSGTLVFGPSGQESYFAGLNGAHLTNAGTLDIDGSMAIGGPGGPQFNFPPDFMNGGAAAFLANEGLLENTGTISLGGGALGSGSFFGGPAGAALANTGTLVNDGLMTLGGGGGSGAGNGGAGASLSNAGSFNNNGSVVLGGGGDGPGGGAGAALGNTGALTNAGTITLDAGGAYGAPGNASPGASIDNTGTLTNTGVISLAGGGTASGVYIGAPGATLIDGGLLANGGTIVVGGPGAASGATAGGAAAALTVVAGGTLLDTATINDRGSLVNAGTLALTGAGASLTVAPAQTLSTSGLLTIGAGADVTLSGGTDPTETPVIGTGEFITAAGTAGASLVNTGMIGNAGTLTLGAAGTSSLYDPPSNVGGIAASFSNNGVLINTGTLSAGGGVDNVSTAGNGAAVTNTGTMINDGLFSLGGGAGGFFSTAGAGATLVNGGTLVNNGTLELGGAGIFPNSGAGAALSGDGALINTGLIMLGGGGSEGALPSITAGNGASLVAGGTLTNMGNIILGGGGTADGGAGASLDVLGMLANSGTITLAGAGAGTGGGAGASLLVGTRARLVNAGTIAIAAGGSLSDAGTLTTTGLLSVAGTTTVAAGATLAGEAGATTFLSSVTNNGTIVSGTAMDITGPVTAAEPGHGLLDVAAGGLLVVDTVAAAETVSFVAGATGKLALADGANFSGDITRFGRGDQIDLANLLFTAGASASYDAATEILAVSSGGDTVDLALQFAAGTAAAVTLSGDGDIGTLVEVVCFVAGTAIATPDGERAIETLRAGDPVLTADGAVRPVRWLGRQTVATRFADPLRVLPIRIRAGALGEQLPVRDLLVSPDHALMVNGVFAQAGALVNGVTVTREDRNVPETLVYFHVELRDHSLILAEGVAAETFIDNVDRLAFDNWDEHAALDPADAPLHEMAHPRAKSHRQVPHWLRQRLAAATAA